MLFTSNPHSHNPIFRSKQSPMIQTSEATETQATPTHEEEISYEAVEKDGKITAIWEKRGRKHLRTIDPRSEEGKHLLGHHDDAATEAAPEIAQNATV